MAPVVPNSRAPRTARTGAYQPNRQASVVDEDEEFNGPAPPTWRPEALGEPASSSPNGREGPQAQTQAPGSDMNEKRYESPGPITPTQPATIPARNAEQRPILDSNRRLYESPRQSPAANPASPSFSPMPSKQNTVELDPRGQYSMSTPPNHTGYPGSHHPSGVPPHFQLQYPMYPQSMTQHPMNGYYAQQMYQNPQYGMHPMSYGGYGPQHMMPQQPLVRSGHKYGNVTISGDAKVVQGNSGNALHLGLAGKDHEYGQLNMSSGAVFQGDISTDDLRAFIETGAGATYSTAAPRLPPANVKQQNTLR